MNLLPSLDGELERLARDFLESAGATSEEEQQTAIRLLIESLPEGEFRELGLRLFALSEKEDTHNAKQREQIKSFLENLAETPDDEIDSTCCDFYVEAGALKGEAFELLAETERCRGLLREMHAQQNHEFELQAAADEFSAERDRLADFASLIVAKTTQHTTQATFAGAPTPPHSNGDRGRLSAAVEAFCENQLAEGSWTPKTEQENRAILALWLRIVGDGQISGYGYEQHRGYKSMLLKLPANLNKNPRYRGKPLVAVIALGDAPAAPNTINKNLTRVAAFFRWALGHGYSTFSPAGGMTIKNPKRANEERQAFSQDDLQKLFQSPDFINGTHRQPYMHWSPLIALYTGARINEIAQLHTADFIEESGIPVMSINDEGEGKRLKTKAGKRLIPIHAELIRLGLLAYVEKLRKKGVPRLFPELLLRRDGYGQTVSRWFARYSDKCGVADAGKVFHSFRHTVIDQLKQAGIPKEKIAALVGHEDESTTFGRYGKDFRADVMLEVVYGLNTTATRHLKKFEGYNK